MRRGAVKEGKIELFATEDGVFTVDVDRLDTLNDLPDIMVATRHNNSPVNAGDKLGGTRIIPLLIDRKRIQEAQALVGKEPLMRLTPYRKNLKAGIVTTGNEVFHGRITDKFTPVVEKKLAALGVPLTERRISDDSTENIVKAIAEVRASGVDIVLCTGGMSVDPDDRTPAAIRDSGANIITYGAPVLPGAMFLLGYYDDGVPVMGLPGCVMYSRASIFDIVLPRVVAGMPISRRDLTRLGNGGLCLQCEVCTYPNCGFGKE
jgi:hypothetical protein